MAAPIDRFAICDSCDITFVVRTEDEGFAEGDLCPACKSALLTSLDDSPDAN